MTEANLNVQPDDDNTAQVAEFGAQLLVRLSALLRTGRTYDVANQAFQQQMQETLRLLRSILEIEDEVALVSVADYFYLNGIRIRAQKQLLPVYHSLMNEYERRMLGGVRFLDGVSGPEVERFFQLFLSADDAGVAERFTEMVEEASIEHIIPVPAVQLEEDDLTRQLDDKDDQASERGRAKRVFWRAVLGTKKILLRAKQSGESVLDDPTFASTIDRITKSTTKAVYAHPGRFLQMAANYDREAAEISQQIGQLLQETVASFVVDPGTIGLIGPHLLHGAPIILGRKSMMWGSG